MNIYAVYDNKAKAWLDPFVSINNAVAQRHFANGANQEGTQLNKNPEDYTLYHVGTWNDDTGECEKVDKENLGMAADYKRE